LFVLFGVEHFAGQTPCPEDDGDFFTVQNAAGADQNRQLAAVQFGDGLDKPLELGSTVTVVALGQYAQMNRPKVFQSSASSPCKVPLAPLSRW
jgi:hypothetical protein